MRTKLVMWVDKYKCVKQLGGHNNKAVGDVDGHGDEYSIGGTVILGMRI